MRKATNCLAFLLIVNVLLLLDPISCQINFVNKFVKKDLDYPPNYSAGQQRAALAADLGLYIGDCNACNGLNFFAFRNGTHKSNIATAVYLTAPASCSGELTFTAYSGTNGRPADSQLFKGTQLEDGGWVLESKLCSFRFIKANTNSTIILDMGPYFSSKFLIQYHREQPLDHHIHVKSMFWSSSYWDGSSTTLKLGAGASRFIVQFWPDFKWP